MVESHRYMVEISFSLDWLPGHCLVTRFGALFQREHLVADILGLPKSHCHDKLSDFVTTCDEASMPLEPLVA